MVNLSTFYDLNKDNNSGNINIKTPPSMEDIISLSKNIATVKLYENLALKNNWKNFSKYIKTLKKQIKNY